jgi:hypothetical protein
MDFVAGFVTQRPQFLKSGGLDLVGEIFKWNSFQALEGKLDGADGGTARDGLSPGKVADRRESGLQVLVRVADLWVRFLLGLGRVRESFRGRMGICPWIFDGGGGGFFPQTGSGLMDFVTGFVTEGFQFLLDGELELVAVIFMWNLIQALEAKLEGAEACV